MSKGKKNQVVISGMVRLPSDIADQIETREAASEAAKVDFMMTPELLFRGDADESFNLRARLRIDETYYYVANKLGSKSLTICYTVKKPDSSTERQIKKMVLEKGCF